MINLVKTLTPEILTINKINDSTESLKIKPPCGMSTDSPLKIRLLSVEFREGMVKW